MNTRESITAWLAQHSTIIGTTLIHDDLSVTILGDITIDQPWDSDYLPIVFQKVTGRCELNNLTNLRSLRNAPKSVSAFTIGLCPHLKNLVGGPVDVIKYVVHHADIISVAGLPDYITELQLRHLPALPSLKGCPEAVRVFVGTHLPSLRSLIGGPQFADTYSILSTGIRNLDGAPAKVPKLFANENFELTSLKGCPEQAQILSFNNAKKLLDLQGITRELQSLCLLNAGITTLDGIGQVYDELTLSCCKKLCSIAALKTPVNKLLMENTTCVLDSSVPIGIIRTSALKKPTVAALRAIIENRTNISVTRESQLSVALQRYRSHGDLMALLPLLNNKAYRSLLDLFHHDQDTSNDFTL